MRLGIVVRDGRDEDASLRRAGRSSSRHALMGGGVGGGCLSWWGGEREP